MTGMVNASIDAITKKEYSNIGEVIKEIEKYTNDEKVGKIDEEGLDKLSAFIDTYISKLKTDSQLWKTQVNDIIISNPKFNELSKELRKAWRGQNIPSRKVLFERLSATSKVYESLNQAIVDKILTSAGYNKLYVRSNAELKTYFEIHNEYLLNPYSEFQKWQYAKSLIFASKNMKLESFLSGILRYGSLYNHDGNTSRGSFYRDNIKNIKSLIEKKKNNIDIIKYFHCNGVSMDYSDDEVRMIADEYYKYTGEKIAIHDPNIEILKIFAKNTGLIDGEYKLLIPVVIYVSSNYPELSFFEHTKIKKIDECLYDEFFNKCHLTINGTGNNTLIKCVLNKADSMINIFEQNTEFVQSNIKRFEDSKQSIEDFIELLKNIFSVIGSEKEARIPAAFDKVRDTNLYADIFPVLIEEYQSFEKAEQIEENILWYSVDNFEHKMSSETKEALKKIMENWVEVDKLKDKDLPELRQRFCTYLLFAFNLSIEETNELLKMLDYSKLCEERSFDALMLSAFALRGFIYAGEKQNLSSVACDNFSSSFRILYRNCIRTRAKFDFAVSKFFDYYLI